MPRGKKTTEEIVREEEAKLDRVHGQARAHLLGPALPDAEKPAATITEEQLQRHADDRLVADVVLRLSRLRERAGKATDDLNAWTKFGKKLQEELLTMESELASLPNGAAAQNKMFDEPDGREDQFRGRLDMLEEAAAECGPCTEAA